MKQIIIFLTFSLLAIISCKSEEDKFIQSEFDKVAGTWKIDGFALVGASASQQNLFNNSTIRFARCVSNAKELASGLRACGGDCQLGELLFEWSYSYDYAQRYYKIDLSETDEYRKNNQQFDTRSVIVRNMMRGNWDIIVDGDKMTAKQIKNGGTSNVQISFIATRK